MEEKEKFVVVGSITAKDRETNDYLEIEEAVELLNQQQKRIKELESKLRVSNSLNASLSLDYNELKKQYDSQEKLLSQVLADRSKLTFENQQLKQSQKQIAIYDKATKKDCFNDIKRLHRIYLILMFFYNDYRILDSLEKDGQRIQHIAQRLKELGGGENECENRVVKH